MNLPRKIATSADICKTRGRRRSLPSASTPPRRSESARESKHLVIMIGGALVAAAFAFRGLTGGVLLPAIMLFWVFLHWSVESHS